MEVEPVGRQLPGERRTNGQGVESATRHILAGLWLPPLAKYLLQGIFGLLGRSAVEQLTEPFTLRPN